MSLVEASPTTDDPYKPNVWPGVDQWAPFFLCGLGVLLCLPGLASLVILGMLSMLLGLFFAYLPLPIYLLAAQQRCNSSFWPVLFAFIPGLGHVITWFWGAELMQEIKSARGLAARRSRLLYVLAPRYALGADLTEVFELERDTAKKGAPSMDREPRCNT